MQTWVFTVLQIKDQNLMEEGVVITNTTTLMLYQWMLASCPLSSNAVALCIAARVYTSDCIALPVGKLCSSYLQSKGVCKARVRNWGRGKDKKTCHNKPFCMSWKESHAFHDRQERVGTFFLVVDWQSFSKYFECRLWHARVSRVTSPKCLN